MVKKFVVTAYLGGQGGGRKVTNVFSINDDSSIGSENERLIARALGAAVSKPFPDSVKFDSVTTSEWHKKGMAAKTDATVGVHDISDYTGGRPVNSATEEFAPTNVTLKLKHTAIGGRAGTSRLRGALLELDIKTGATGGTSIVTDFAATNAAWTAFHTAHPNAMRVTSLRKGQSVATSRDVTSTTVVGISKAKDSRKRKKKVDNSVAVTEEPENVIQKLEDLLPFATGLIGWALSRKLGLDPVKAGTVATIASQVGDLIKQAAEGLLGDATPTTP